MPTPNLKLHVVFEFEVAAPETLLSGDHDALCRKFGDLLGGLALQGMPKVTATQLAKVGASLVAHHHRLDVRNLDTPVIERAALIAAAPHLTDEELDRLAQQGGKIPGEAAEQRRHLRRQALALVKEYRLVPCQVEGRLKSNGTAVTLSAMLNLTNGRVMVGEADRQHRLQTGPGAVTVLAAGGAASLAGNCEGHTLSGPVIGVSIDDIAKAREVLIGLWRKRD
jgi:hypothetical protein